MFTLKYKMIDKDAVLPSYAHEGDAGLDLCSVETKKIKPHRFCMFRTGICIELPPNTEAQVRPRSGLAAKYGVTVLNTPGTIDETYRGEICVVLINHGRKTFTVEKGMKIAQMVIQPTYEVVFEQVEEFSCSNRGSNSFGSSGI